MDILSELLLQLFNLYNFLQPYLLRLISTFYSLQYQLLPLLRPILTSFTTFAQNSPTIVTFAVLLLLLAISLQILNFAQRVVVFWTKLFFKLFIVGGVLVMGMAVYSHGIGNTVTELIAWGQEISEVFGSSYEGHKKAQSAGRSGGNRYGNAGTGWL